MSNQNIWILQYSTWFLHTCTGQTGTGMRTRRYGGVVRFSAEYLFDRPWRDPMIQPETSTDIRRSCFAIEVSDGLTLSCIVDQNGRETPAGDGGWKLNLSEKSVYEGYLVLRYS